MLKMIQRRMSSFEWDLDKEASNFQKHKVDFQTAIRVFKDPHRRIITDSKHSQSEDRYFCIGKVAGRILLLGGKAVPIREPQTAIEFPPFKSAGRGTEHELWQLRIVYDHGWRIM